jgi:hypothetical protein
LSLLDAPEGKNCHSEALEDEEEEVMTRKLPAVMLPVEKKTLGPV